MCWVLKWATPEIGCTPPTEVMEMPNTSPILIGNSQKIKHFLGHKGEDMEIPKNCNCF